MVKAYPDKYFPPSSLAMAITSIEVCWERVTLIFIMTVFCFLDKKTQVHIPEPKCTGSVFVLSVLYQYRFFLMLKKTIIMKMRVERIIFITHCKQCTIIDDILHAYICVCMYSCVYVYTHIYAPIFCNSVICRTIQQRESSLLHIV